MTANTITLIKKRGHIVPVGVFTKIIKEFSKQYGLAVAVKDSEGNERIVTGRGAIENDAATEAKSIMDHQNTYKDNHMVFWFSKNQVTEESLQPFSIFSTPIEDSEESHDKIVAFLTGDFKEKMKKESPHSGEFWAHVEDTRPTVMKFLADCADTDGDISPETMETKWKEKHKEVSDKIFINQDNSLILLLWDGRLLMACEKEVGEGHHEQNYWVSSLIEEPAAPKKSNTISLGSYPPKEVKPAENVDTELMAPLSWALGSEQQTQKFYRKVNMDKDPTGGGKVPKPMKVDGKYVSVKVDKRVKDAISRNEIKSFQDLNTFLEKLKSSAAPITKPADGDIKKTSPGQYSIVKETASRLLSAEEKESLNRDFTPLVKSGKFPTEIQAEEKDVPTFTDLTGITHEDLKKASFSFLHEKLTTTHPKASAQLIHDLLHRPLGTIRGTVGESGKDEHPPATSTKPKPGGIRLAS